MAANGTCHKCGLVHCHGSRCDQCAGTCWETPRPVFANTWLWTEHKKLFWTSCDGPWQLLWPLPGASVTPAGQDLVLRVVLKFKDKQTLTMHFSSVVLKGNFLSVGESSDSLDAASWWGAPFDQRTLSSGGNCRKFFYPPAERCQANGVLTVDEQLELYNATLDKGYAWLTGDDQLDRTQISAIELWMKPVD
ncbi:uncharacterized protein [Penaeus vannamei]|uniref:uncharacterized protein n=1 Tax=Penaeus vannamei TaxID=6689 RepID=UPI00387FA4B0